MTLRALRLSSRFYLRSLSRKVGVLAAPIIGALLIWAGLFCLVLAVAFFKHGA